MRRLTATAALAVLCTFVWVGSAWGCSCAPRAPGESLRQADAAVVGRLVEVLPHGLHADYRYEIERVYRGSAGIERGQMLTVRSGRSSAACALPRRLDRRYGLFLLRDGDRWIGGICGVVEPGRLWHAAQQRSPAYRRGSGGSGPDGCSI